MHGFPSLLEVELHREPVLFNPFHNLVPSVRNFASSRVMTYLTSFYFIAL